RCLIGHAGHPFEQILIEQTGQAHEHATYRAVSAYEILDTAAESSVDDGAIHWIENDDGIVGHAQGAGGVDPYAVPARCTQLWIDRRGVVAALSGKNDGELFQRFDVVGVLKRTGSVSPCRGCTARVAGRKNHRLKKGKIILVAHALHEDGSHHATPTD